MRRRDFIKYIVAVAASARPITARAQQSALSVIGFLHFGSARQFAYQVAAFEEGLKDSGFVNGQNVDIEQRWAEGQYDRLPALAADLVTRNVDVIVALGPPCAIEAKRATLTIPIVFTSGDDPVQSGLVDSLGRPGGNATGVSILAVQLVPKRLELLCQFVPQARTFALLVNPGNGYSEVIVRDMRAAAAVKGVEIEIVRAGTEREIDAAFATLANVNAGALVIGDDPYFVSRAQQLTALASRYSIPAAYQFREFAAAGGLISYGPSLANAVRQAGAYAGMILKGTKPSQLPVIQPTHFELVINMKTAKMLGLSVPSSLLATADDVIE